MSLRLIYLALLRCGIVERGRSAAGMGLDRAGKFGERYGDALGGRCVGSEFVVATAEVVHEGVPGDDHLRGPVNARPGRGE